MDLSVLFGKLYMGSNTMFETKKHFFNNNTQHIQLSGISQITIRLKISFMNYIFII